MRPSGSPNTVVASSNVTLCLARLAAAFGACHSNLGGSINYVGSALPDAHNAQAERPASGRTAPACCWAAYAGTPIGCGRSRSWYADGCYQEEY
jgi:hypothetical protein